jgi:hypothetical protein
VRRLAIAAAVLAFLGLSLVLGRYLTFEGRERDALIEALREQPRAQGDEVEVLRVDSDTAYALGPARGTSRVAWRLKALDQTFVQCADVERTGNVLSARRIILHRLSEPIGLEASCPD